MPHSALLMPPRQTSVSSALARDWYWFGGQTSDFIEHIHPRSSRFRWQYLARRFLLRLLNRRKNASDSARGLAGLSSRMAVRASSWPRLGGSIVNELPAVC